MSEPTLADLVPGGGKTIAVAFAGLLLIGGIAMSYHQVPEGHVGVEKSWGAVNGQVHDAGPAWTVPIQDSVKTVEIRPRAYTMSDTQGEGQQAGRRDAIEAPTLNGTNVRIDVTVRYHVKPDKADAFVSEWNNVEQAEQRLIRPSVRSALRDEAGAIYTSDIYTQEGRQRLAQAAREVLSQEFSDEALVLEAVQVRNVNLPDEYQEQLNKKEIAKQEVQREEYRLEQAQVEKQRMRVEAEAEAQQIRITGEAIRENPEVLQLRYIQALRHNNNTVYIPMDSGMTLTREVDAPRGANGNASGLLGGGNVTTTNGTVGGA